MELNDMLAELNETIDGLRPEINALSQAIWSHPEVAYEEVFACKTQVDLLKKHGLEVKDKVYGLDTSYVTSVGEDHPAFAFAAEYDALPGIGHACGHNLICSTSIAAFLAARAYMEKHGIKGRLVLIGTPAEEGSGGKVTMEKNGCLKDIDAVMMAHGASNSAYPDTGSTGVKRYNVTFHGRSTHAGGSPTEGRSALDGIMLMYAGINAYRQMIPGTVRIHGIVTEGGDAPNIIPETASAKFYLRSLDEGWMARIDKRFNDIVKGAALMTDTTVDCEVYSNPYKATRPNKTLNDLYSVAEEAQGIPVDQTKGPSMGSTDFGNFGQAIPGVHVHFPTSDVAFPGHTIEMREASGSEKGFNYAMKTAGALAACAIQYLTNPEIRKNAREDFEKNA